MGSYAFGAGGSVAPGTQYFNVWNDSTGSFLAANNGDLWDLSITYSQVVPASGAPSGNATAGLSYDAVNDRFTMSHSFAQGNSAGFPTFNNPGTRIEGELTVRFASHISATDLILDFTSLNTSGLTWENSLIGYLKTDGTPFSAAPSVAPYGSHTTVNGSSALGWFLVDSKATVTGVGTGTTAAGANGSYDNLTATGANSYLDYNDVGLPSGQVVGGFVWQYRLEDVRGTLNNSSSLSASFFDMRVGGLSVVPESGLSGRGLVVLLTASLGLLGWQRIRSRRG